ncbi:MAG: hypothetical protein K9K62_11795 [Desulfobacteraceae bacterium]|nr:hypothetical protein [Desulfobacteraceae bacterium]
MRKTRTMLLLLCAAFMPAMFFVPQAAANESAVEIEAPAEAVAAEQVTIVLNVSHEGNNFIHHTEWVELRINGETAKRWEYSMFGKPPGEKFSVSFSYTAEESLELEAEASCNLHGSRNVAEQTITVESAASSEQSAEPSGE